MPIYLDIGAVQIQPWLGRTNDLKGRRGASGMLALATSRSHWDSRLPAGSEWNVEAGDVDGVVSLRVDDSVSAEAVARECLVELRAELPSAAFETSWASGTSYFEAYPEMARRRERGEGLTALPSTPELPLALPCARCAASPASEEVSLAEGERHLVCADCGRRYAHAGDRGRPAPIIDRALTSVAEVLRCRPDELTVPDDMEALALVGHGDLDDAATRVAVIYADGNNVGAFMQAAAKNATVNKEEIAAAINDSTLAAFGAAAAMARADLNLAVVPHMLGGDDLVVSTTARYAWAFLITFLDAFSNQLKSRTAGWPKEVTESLPTASAGIVVHHRSRPLSDCIDIASHAMAAAKELPGPAVQYLDLFQDKPEAIDERSRSPRTLDWIERRRPAWTSLAQRPSSVRKTLVGHTRLSDPARALAEFQATTTKFALNEFDNDLGDLDAARWLLDLAADIDVADDDVAEEKK